MKFIEKKIEEIIGRNYFYFGSRYPRGYINYDGEYKENNVKYYNFSVESEYDYDYYDVKIGVEDGKFKEYQCSCSGFKANKMCSHISACLIHFQSIYDIYLSQEDKLLLSKDILKEFYKESKNGKINLKKQLTLEVGLTFNNRYDSMVQFNFRIGEGKLYSLNNKFSKFIRIYLGEEDNTLSFGKSFEYNRNNYFFSKNDEKIIDYLAQLYKGNPYYNFQYLSIDAKRSIPFIELMGDKEIYISGHGRVNSVVKGNPFKLSLGQENGVYKLQFKKEGCTILSNDYSFVAKESTLYIIPENLKKVLHLLQDNGIESLTFEEEDIESFSLGVLPIVKENVELEKSVEDKFILGVKPKIKIYLDLKKGLILGSIKLDYNGEELDYFDSSNKILRDIDAENAVIEDLLTFGFVLNNNQIYMEDIDIIGDFLENNLVELAKKYEVFTSDNLKNMRIVKDNNVRTSFSIGSDNIMKYEFDLGDIKNDEIVNILEEMKKKKRYYRLKSGDLIDLTENEDLNQLENLVEDMDLTSRDLKAGSGVIPKYRAIYLDSIKKDKYNIITTNNLFDELIDKFSSYKDMDINITTEEKKILRDYQVVGVKWLYNIYKCGFGGILADEMGLGKSIQLIYFIKQILKEKKEAKILIIAPTSLIYNWKNEFDKFGRELRYKVFAENKNVRKQELDHLDDVDILITTYGLVRQDQEKYMEMNFELIAIDEAQNIKNVNAQMTKVVKELNANTKVALTGTPLENSVSELWSIFDFIMPGYLTNLLDFQRKYNVSDVGEEELDVLSKLNKQIRPFILRRKKKDVVKDLPDKIENVIYIDLNKEQKKLYLAELEKTNKEMEEILATEGFKKGNFKILQLLTKLRQMCIDPSLLYENYKSGSAKIENLLDIVKGTIENGHKILLFSSFKSALDIVNTEFTNKNISSYFISGGVPAKERMELVERFNEDDTNVFLITIKAGGTGLNLTSADVVIHLDLWWNPAVEDQATDRAHRIGQTKKVEVVKLVCKGTIEERILELQNKKKALSDALIEGEDRDKNILSKLTEKDIKNLLSLDNDEEDE